MWFTGRYISEDFKIVVVKSSRLPHSDLYFESEGITFTQSQAADLESCPVPSAGGSVL
jgi:hypothetical protein